MPSILPLSTVDPAAIERLLDEAFGADRHTRTAYRIRSGMSVIEALSFAVVDGPELLGAIQCWPIALDNEPLVLVGPVAVARSVRGAGIGRTLMHKMLAAADLHGEDALALIGDPEYYQRHFGFSADHTGDWQVPGPVERHRLLARLAGPRLIGRSGMLGPLPARPASG